MVPSPAWAPEQAAARPEVPPPTTTSSQSTVSAMSVMGSGAISKDHCWLRTSAVRGAAAAAVSSARATVRPVAPAAAATVAPAAPMKLRRDRVVLMGGSLLRVVCGYPGYAGRLCAADPLWSFGCGMPTSMGCPRAGEKRRSVTSGVTGVHGGEARRAEGVARDWRWRGLWLAGHFLPLLSRGTRRATARVGFAVAVSPPGVARARS